MKELYTKPIVSVDEYETVDVIATSIEQFEDED
jgi:hypothetical protein